MAEEKEKVIQKDQETIKPTEDLKDELSERDLDKTAGGYLKKVDIIYD